MALPEVVPEPGDREGRSLSRPPDRCFREQLVERLGSDVADPEIQDPVTLANDLAGLYLDMKEALLSIPEHVERVPGFMIWNWTFAVENEAGGRAIQAREVVRRAV